MEIWVCTNISASAQSKDENQCLAAFVAGKNTRGERVTRYVIFDLCSIGRGKCLWLNMTDWFDELDTIKHFASKVEEEFEGFKRGFLSGQLAERKMIQKEDEE